MRIPIVYEDDALVLCEKPIGLSSEREEADSLPEALDTALNEKGERASVYAVHRLDKAVGGLMVYAKSQKAAAFLSKEIAEKRMQKTYYAVVSGEVQNSLGESGELSDLLFKDNRKNKSFVVTKARKGVKDAKLAYRVISQKESENGRLTLLAITLMTGRSHQIRVQFSSRGFPLYGDGKYGSRYKGDIALYSHALSFLHPVTKRQMTWTLPLPDRYPFTLWKEES